MTWNITQDAPESGFRTAVPMTSYLSFEALGSTHLGWLAVSPLYYRHMMGVPERMTPALAFGTAVHMAVLEPERFRAQYRAEPDPFEVAPDAKSPRSTKAYREACAELEESGFAVLRHDAAEKVAAMTHSVQSNPHVQRLLARAPEREITLLWDRDGRPCRGRADILGEGVLADLKTTRNLARFSPFELTRFGYYRQLAWYRDGLKRLGRDVAHVLIVAVESEPPYDCAVFALDDNALGIGALECEALLVRLEECEASNQWPGQFPDIQKATVTDALTAETMTADLEVA